MERTSGNKERTLGWIQDASDITKLKNIVQIFMPESEWNKKLRTQIIPSFKPPIDKDSMLKQLSAKKIEIDFPLLVGRGPLKGETRATATCSGIAQAVLPAQNGKSYQSDWATKSFVLWAIAIGFLNYDSVTDRCALSDLGKNYAEATEQEENDILIKAHLSYPPVCRILNLLNEKPSEYFTKFEIGGRLGFCGEDGFTSYSVRLILDGLRLFSDKKEQRKFLQNTEGTSDKYARTICNWLQKLGLIEKGKKTMEEDFGGKKFNYSLSAYRITMKGKQAITHNGNSRHAQIPKIVYYEMLATKAKDAIYLRQRRALLINYLTKGYRTIDSCVQYLQKEGLTDNEYAIEDDIEGLENIGLSVAKKRTGEYKITDKIQHLQMPKRQTSVAEKSDIEQIKDRLRPLLKVVNHKYLALIDMGFGSGRKGVSRDYELMTADLLTEELKFKGGRLGDSRKPDVCIYHGINGLIIDNKAYNVGYSLPISQADEMVRYLEENKERSIERNSNQWWLVFSPEVKHFNFAFVSGTFVGTFKNRLKNIYHRTGVCGAAINSENLIYWAELIKSGNVSYEEAIKYFDCNEEIQIVPAY